MLGNTFSAGDWYRIGRLWLNILKSRAIVKTPWDCSTRLTRFTLNGAASMMLFQSRIRASNLLNFSGYLNPYWQVVFYSKMHQ